MEQTGLTVLIVEDNVAQRTILTEYARGAGYLVLAAGTVSEALAHIDDADILLLDWRLEGSDAEPVLSAWVSQKTTPALVLTGILDKVKRHRLMVAGAYHAEEKPVEAQLILTLLRRYQHYVQMERSLAVLQGEVEKLGAVSKKLKYVAVVTSVLAVVGAGPQVEGLIQMVLTLL